MTGRLAAHCTLVAALGDPAHSPTRSRRPAYDRSQVTAGIVHFGVGGFHRAHQAMYLDRLMNDGKALDWGICGVGALPARPPDRDTLTAQDGLYTLVVKHPDGTREPRVIGAIVETLFAPDDPEAVRRHDWPTRATRIVSLTITEGGYLVNQVTGEFDAADPSIQADLGRRRRPRHGRSATSPRRSPGAASAGEAAVHRDVVRQPARATATSPSG